MKLPYEITLVVGDWSHDGHSMTENFFIKSNLNSSEIKSAYAQAVKKTGIDFQKSLACDYEDNYVPNDVVKKLEPFGLKIKDHAEVDQQDGDEEYSLWPNGYVTAWLFFVKIGNPKFAYKIVDKNNSSINIGGYGLFSS